MSSSSVIFSKVLSFAPTFTAWVVVVLCCKLVLLNYFENWFLLSALSCADVFFEAWYVGSQVYLIEPCLNRSVRSWRADIFVSPSPNWCFDKIHFGVPPMHSTCSRLIRSSKLVRLSIAPWLMASRWKESNRAFASVTKIGASVGFFTFKISLIKLYGLKIKCQKRTTNFVVSTAWAADWTLAAKLERATLGKPKFF